MKLIDIEPMRPRWGQVWQSGEEEVIERHNVPLPWVIFSMVGSLDFTAKPVTAVFIEDEPTACLPDETLLSLVQCAIIWLKGGYNVLIHCFEGKSRSSYLDIAIHMAVLKLGYNQAFGYVKHQHPLCQPNIGFEAQLRQLETALREMPV